MNYHIKFVNDTIKPWEKLNSELINQNFIDSNISDLVSSAGDLAVRINHFTEISNNKNVILKDYSNVIIKDVADALKHGELNKTERRNKLYLSSLIEGNNEEEFRFIRNKITIEHNTYGNNDFLENSKLAIQNIIKKLSFNLIWNPKLLESSVKFSPDLLANISLIHQIVFSDLRIEFLKKNTSGELIHYDPPSWNINIGSAFRENPIDFFKYIFFLLKNSIGPESQISTKTKFPTFQSKSDLDPQILIQTSINDEESKTVVQILNEINYSLTELEQWKKDLTKHGVNKLIIVSKNEFKYNFLKQLSYSPELINIVVINNLAAHNIPIEAFKIIHKHENYKVTKIQKVKIFFPEEKKDLLTGEEDLAKTLKLSIDKKNVIPLNLLCLELLRVKGNKEHGRESGRESIFQKMNDNLKIFYKINDEFIEIEMEVEFEWKMNVKDLQTRILSFVKDELGLSIWNSLYYINFSDGFMEFKLFVVKYGNTSALSILPDNSSQLNLLH